MKMQMTITVVTLVALSAAGCAHTSSGPQSSSSTTTTSAPPAEKAPSQPVGSIPSVPADAQTPVTTASGLIYQDFVVGTGASPVAGREVAVRYIGWLTNGTSIDNDHGTPYSFPIGRSRVIAGWDEGIMSMKVGGKRRLTVPASLAYGREGAGGLIPPNATLIFDVELVIVSP